MKNKELKFDQEAQKELFEGLTQVYKAVSSTLGPSGKNVIIENDYGMPISTKDGVSVSKSIKLKNPVQNQAAQMIKQAAQATNDVAGDGPQPLYSKVLTPTGFKSMGELNVGDEICGTNNTFQTVIGVYPKGQKEIYKVHFSDGRIVECCEDHLWNVTTHYGSNKTLTVKQLIETGKILTEHHGQNMYGYYVPKTIVDFKESDEFILDPYLVGTLIGDGSLSKDGSIELGIGYKKKHILDKIKLPDGIIFNAKYYPEKNYYRVKFSGKTKDNKTIHALINEIGLLNTNSHTKYIPKNYLYSSLENRENLLHGLLDTDGHINNENLFEFSTVSESLNNDFITLCRSLGYSVYTILHTREHDKDSYSDTDIFRIRQLKGYKYGNKLVKINSTGKFTEMQCIKVSNEDNLYITDDFIVTHNTTTSTVLAYNIIKEGLKHVNSGVNRTDLKNGIQKAVLFITDELKKISKPVQDNKEIEQVAAISANNDDHIGKLIATGMDKVGKNGVITTERSNSSEDSVETVEGIRFNNGYLSPYFITNNQTMQVEYENPYILLYDGKISVVKSIQKILESVHVEHKPIIIIAEDVAGEALAMLVVNKSNGVIGTAAVKAPEFGERRKEALQDIAILTNGTVISPDKGLSLDKMTKEHLGTCRKFTCNNKFSTIIDGSGSEDAIIERVRYIQNKIENADSDFEKEQLQNRLARLSGGIAILNIGAETEIEMEDKKYRVEDALNATKAAVEDGIIVGGGLALMNIAKKSKKTHYPKLINDEQFGFDIVMKAIQAPFNFILENAGYNAHEIYSKMRDKNQGFDIRTNKYVDFFKSGIIDPTLVVKTALSKAASVASQFLITDCVITNEIEQEKVNQNMMYE